MVNAGVDVNTIDEEAYRAIARFEDEKNNSPPPVLRGGSLLDIVQARLTRIESAIANQSHMPEPPTLEDDHKYLEGTVSGSYEHWYLTNTIKVARNVVREWQEARKTALDEHDSSPGAEQKLDRLRALREKFEDLRDQLLQKVRGRNSIKLPRRWTYRSLGEPTTPYLMSVQKQH